MSDIKTSRPRAFYGLYARSLAWLEKAVLGSRSGIRDVVLSMIPRTAQVVTRLFPSILVAHGLGPSRLGQFTLVTSASGVATSLSELGIGQTAIRFASLAVPPSQPVTSKLKNAAIGSALGLLLGLVLQPHL